MSSPQTDHRTAPTDLVGVWAFTRRIDDRAGGRRGSVTGRMTLSPEPDGRLRWFEEGELRFPGSPPVPVHRTYYVEPRTGGEDDWFVTFEDGRDFHAWRPGEVVEHPCKADLYRGLIHEPAAGTRGWSVMSEASAGQGLLDDDAAASVRRPPRAEGD